ncbi:ATP-binding protein [Hyphococcus formosus]|uniref:PAS domain-containing hybrid sensor histidine kinase/response regulator n=1 Tax=Hyphococcus formosus TaxID=3143534 RepID=UPI00398B0C90
MLIERENLCVALFENAPEAVAVADLDRRIVAINPAFTKLFGYTIDEVRGRQTEFLYADPSDYQKTGIERFHPQAEAQPSPYELDYQTKSGKIICGETIGTRVTDNEGNAIGYIGFTRDVSERKKVFEELEKARSEAENANHSKSLFLTNMGHEIRTPMNGVLGMASALSGTKLDDNQRQMLSVITKSGNDLLTLLNDLLDLSKVEAGAIRIEPTYFNLADLAFQVEQLHAQRALEKGIELKVDIEPATSGCWNADPMRIRQVLHNLMSNAIKFTKLGSVDLRVTSDDDMLIFTVKDTGVGIAESDYDVIFELFRQAGDRQFTPASGAGLGLSISRRLARLMGGDLTVKSEVGQGSEFTLTVKAEKMERLGGGEQPVSNVISNNFRAGSPKAQKPLKVLVAEDNVTNQMVLEALLKSTKVEYEIVENGRKCLDRLSEERFDAILMDIKMPVMDGVEATLKIRAEERRQNKRRLPIVALTANAMAHQIEKYAAAGMDGCIAKPYRVDDLVEALHQAIDAANAGEPIPSSDWLKRQAAG